MELCGDRLMIIDMGTHMLSGQVGSQNLLQVAIPGLEDRARTFTPLQGVLLMPGTLPTSLSGIWRDQQMLGDWQKSWISLDATDSSLAVCCRYCQQRKVCFMND